MAFPKNKMRKINVNGIDYEYVIAGTEHEDDDRKTINIYIKNVTTNTIFRYKDDDMDGDLQITPKFVRGIIERNNRS